MILEQRGTASAAKKKGSTPMTKDPVVTSKGSRGRRFLGGWFGLVS
jgi:hypothetical protein